MNKPLLSLILPVHNQETIIKPVVDQIKSVLVKNKITFEFILVENGSKDKTLSILKKMAKKDKRLRISVSQKGYGAAVIKGLSVSRGKYVGYMPSDGQIDPTVLPILITKIQKGTVDMVKIKRATRENTKRLVQSKIFNMLANLILGKQPVSDINGSPRIFLAGHLPTLGLKYTDSFIDTEFTHKVKHLKWNIYEHAIPTLPRLGGKSTVSILTVFEFIQNLLYYRFSHDFKRWKELQFFSNSNKNWRPMKRKQKKR